MTNYRVFVQTPNGAKFRADGDVAEVRQDIERFYSMFAVGNAVPAAGEAAVATQETIPGGEASTEGAATAPSAGGLDRAMLDRLFSKDKNGTVSLKALPRGDKAEANALVALIYGAGRLANEDQVTGSRLMKAAVQSGLHQVDRIDRSLSTEIGQFVTTAGFKKGRRYGLTNPGIRRAEEILTSILG